MSSAPLFSIVIPVMDEAGNITPMVREIDAALAGGAVYEIVFVDDGSKDSTAADIKALMPSTPHIRLIRHAENRGQSRGLRTGIEAAKGEWIVTLDGDLQNPPSEIPKLLALKPATGGALIAGIRQKRQDNAMRKIVSRLGNGIRQWWLKDTCPDTGCSLKLFPREAFLALPFFNHMHRYLPTLFKMYGLPYIGVPVAHRPRTAGISKYSNWQRALVGIYDLIGVKWLQRRTKPVAVTEEKP